MRTLLGEIIETFDISTYKKGIKLDVVQDVSVPEYLKGDINRLRQIFLNLIGNASKFTHEGYIRVYVSYNPPYLFFDVEDSGIGIVESELDQIFDPFVQSDMSMTREYGGTGLGLAICKKIALAMEGDISVTSKLGQGSRFSVHVKMEPVERMDVDYKQMVMNWLQYDPTVSDLVVSVIQTLPERYGQMLKASSECNAERLEQIVHGLKGTAGNFHMDELYQIVLEFDKDLKARWTIDDITRDYLQKISNIIEGIPQEYYTMEIFEEPLDAAPVGPLKVLLAEDVSENRELIRQMLLGQPIHLDFAVNGMEVLEKIQKESFDVLLLDIQMPVMGGEEVLENLRKNHFSGNMYIIVLTAHALKEDMGHYIALGADWYMSKPIDKVVLRSKMAELLKMRGLS